MTASRPVVDWTSLKLLHIYRTSLYLIYINSLLLVRLNICILADCICILIHADYLHWLQWPTLLLLSPSLLVLLTTLSENCVKSTLTFIIYSDTVFTTEDMLSTLAHFQTTGVDRISRKNSQAFKPWLFLIPLCQIIC